MALSFINYCRALLRSARIVFVILALSLCALPLQGCGQKGDLYLPLPNEAVDVLAKQELETKKRSSNSKVVQTERHK